MAVRDLRVEAMARVAMLRRCGRDELDALSVVADDALLGPGHELTRQGHRSHHCYMFVDGAAEARVDGEPVGLVSAGDTVGLVSLFDAMPAAATIITVEPSQVVALAHDRLRATMDREPRVASVVAGELARLARTGAPTYLF